MRPGIRSNDDRSRTDSDSSNRERRGIYLHWQRKIGPGSSSVLGTFEWGCTMNDRGHGWIIFAAIVLGVAGIMRIFDAIWAFRYHGAVPQDLEDALFGTSLKTYGWVWLIVGIILILCALAVMGRSSSGRWVGIAAGRHRRHQCHLVDALLPDLVLDLHRARRHRDLRPGRLRRSGRGDAQSTRAEPHLRLNAAV